jgi:hypothetical protein
VAADALADGHVAGNCDSNARNGTDAAVRITIRSPGKPAFVQGCFGIALWLLPARGGSGIKPVSPCFHIINHNQP